MKKRIMMSVFLAASLMASAAVMPAYADAVAGSDQISSQVVRNADNTYYAYIQVPVNVIPVYRFYSTYMRDYFYTVNEEEKNSLEENYRRGTQTYEYQGISGFVEAAPADLGTPVYRFWNEKTGDHFYTTDQAEKEAVEADFAAGRDDYKYEGIAWYEPSMAGTAVYRFFDVKAFNHYYTGDAQIREKLIQEYQAGKGNYRYEGIAWYWFQ